MSGVPYVFGNATTSIPLSQLDVNFATNATLGNATVGLGNTTTTVGNLTVQNVTLSSTNGDANIHGLTVGQGNGSVSTNTVVGASALTANTSGASNTSLGYQTLYSNTTASYNTAVGYQAGYTNALGGANTFVGNSAGFAFVSGSAVNTFNTFIGNGSGSTVTTGIKNTILGSYSGNQGGLDIRTLSNKVVLSDGDGNPYFNLNNGSGSSRILNFDGSEFFPGTDNAISCGYSSYRWSVVYSATALINTSDANQKQQIADLTTAEKSVANSIKGLIKTFKFNEAVTKKGDNARIHIGVIAQEVQSAFIAQGLDPSRYALFCSDTWYEVDGNHLNSGGEFCKKTDEGAVEVTQLGIRYDELLAFVISTL